MTEFEKRGESARLSRQVCLVRLQQSTPRFQLPSSSLRNLMVSWLVACSSAMLSWLSSHADDSLCVQHLSVLTRSPFRWTCDRAWKKRKHNATTRGGVHIHSGCCSIVQHTACDVTPSTSQTFDQLDSANVPFQQMAVCLVNIVTRLTLAEQHRPRCGDDQIGHQNGELPNRQPAHVARVPAESRSRRTRRAARRPSPGLL